MIGQTLSHYRVVSQLGAGGMGVVYKAVDQRLNRSVALKVMPPDKSGDPDRRARFLREARAASALNDPHIVTVYDIFSDGGTDVLVMEHVQGRTLRDWIADGPLAIGRAADIARQIAEGVGAAHAAGIVHRDLKPGNVMVTERGIVKVLDFGLAKLTTSVDDQATISGPNSVPGSLLGTVEYMSPEQARGDAVDHRTDIFSLSCILYEMLTGERPFRAAHKIGVLHEIIFGTVTPPRTKRPEIDGDLEAIVLRGLERDVTRRYQSMEAFASDLQLAQRTAYEPASKTGSVVTPPVPVPKAPPADAVPIAAPRPRIRPRLGRLLITTWPFVVAAAFALPSTRQWLLDHIKGSGESSPAATAAADTTPYGLTQQGLALLATFETPGNVGKAIELFERAITIEDGNAPAHAAIARAYARQAEDTGDKTWSARAIDAAKRAVMLDGYLADAHVALGVALTAAGDHRRAEKALRDALMLDRRNGAAWFSLGDIAYEEDRRDDARAAYEQAFALAPGDWRSAVGAGNVAFRDGRYDDAATWYGRAIAAAPQVAMPHTAMGSAHHMRNDYAAAAAEYQKAISIRPTASAYSNLGTALFADGRYRESVGAFERARQLEPTNPLMWGNLADAQRWTPGGREPSRESYLRAIQLLEERLAVRQANPRDRSRLALYLAKRGDTRAALAALAKVPDLRNRDVNTLYRAAVIHELSGERPEALIWLGVALDRGYSLREVSSDPELAALRASIGYQKLVLRYERAPSP